MPAQPTNHSQNTGLVVIVVGIFMVIIAFLTVTYMNSDAIRTTQQTNSKKASTERSDLTQVTCALWHSVGDPSKLDAQVVTKVKAICPKGS